MLFLKPVWMWGCEVYMCRDTATRDLTKAHVWAVTAKGARMKTTWFVSHRLLLPVCWRASVLCENCPSVFCQFECTSRHNRWSPYFQRVKSLSIGLNCPAVRRRKCVIDSLNAEASVKKAWWRVFECCWVFIVDRQDKGEVHSLNQERTVLSIHTISH